MKKRFMAALLCLCLLTGVWTAAAYATDLEGGDAIVMPSTGSGSPLTVDNIEATTGEGYDVFDTANDIAYSKSIDIYAQAIDTAIENAGTVYKVEIVWGDMAFAWGADDKITKTWNPTDHSYSNDANQREKGWYLLDKENALTKLAYNDGSYSNILSGTAQNYVVMFNHSNAAVNANVKLTEIYQGAEDTTNIDLITASLLPAAFGVTGTGAANGGYDYALSYDTESGVIYSTTNDTAAAAYVELTGQPNDGVLNASAPTTVAKITVTLSIPQETTPDPEQGGSGA